MLKYCVLLITGFFSWHLMGMQIEPYLQFNVNERLAIVDAQEHGLVFYQPKEKFIGKNILESVPLSDLDKVYVAATFEQAAVNSSDEKVVYMVDKKQFTALVKPIFNADKIMFLVTVHAGMQ